MEINKTGLQSTILITQQGVQNTKEVSEDKKPLVDMHKVTDTNKSESADPMKGQKINIVV